MSVPEHSRCAEVFYQTCLRGITEGDLDSSTYECCYAALVADNRRWSADNLRARYLEMTARLHYAQTLTGNRA